MINTIQFLRFIAAMFVVFAHTAYELGHETIGLFGVDIFFVISGFVIALAADKNIEFFLIKRIARIAPIYWLCTIALFCAILALPSLFKTLEADYGVLIKSLLFIPALRENGLYEPLLAVGWTLNYEMYFYAVVQIALLVNRRHFIAVSALLISVLPVADLFFEFPSALAIYSDNIVFEFVYGMACYAAYKKGLLEGISGKPSVLLALLLILFAALVCLPAEALDERALSYGIIAVAILLVTIALNKFIRMPAWAVILGNASYSLYLIHPFMVRGINMAFGNKDLFVQFACVATCSTVLAVIAFYLYEKPVKNAIYRKLSIYKASGTAVTVDNPPLRGL